MDNFRNEQQKQMVIDNMGLVFKVVGKFRLSKFSADYNEYVSNGTFGLMKAVLTFDSYRNINFSTYACKCITNEILMGIRRQKKWKNYISIYETIEESEKREIILLDVLDDPKANFVDKFVTNEILEQAINIALNCLSGQQRLIILYRIGGICQADISNMLEHSYCQSAISRIEKKALGKIMNIYNKDISYKKIITMEIEDKDVYRFSFSKKYIRDSENIINILKKQGKNSFVGFKISDNKDWIEIRTLACEEAFFSIAEIIKEIEEFIINDSIPIIESNTRKKLVKREGKTSKINEYLLTRDMFSIKDLKEHFPNMKMKIIYNAIHLAKDRGLVVHISKGVYRVVK